MPESQTGTPDDGINRRSVLKTAGVTAAVGLGAVGTASATDEADGPPVFCGCSQVCACGRGDAAVLVAVEDGDSFTFHWVEDVQFNFCRSVDDPEVPDGKIVAVQVAGTRWVNPNSCAEKALEAEQEQLDSTHPRPEGRSGGPCGKPPCEHPGRGNGGGNGNGRDNGR